MELLENKPEISMMEHIDFEKFKNDLQNKGIKLSDDIVKSPALAITMNGRHYVFINKTIYDNVDKDYQDIIMLHEFAHCDGVKGEEDADRWVIEMFREFTDDRTEAIEKIKSMWEYRHGHEYREMK
jgi:uncharacterized membrane protein